MSAICGIYDLSGDLEAQELLPRMLAALAPWGRASSAWAQDGRASLGYRHHGELSARSPRYPARFGLQRILLAADIRIDNREELQTRLGLADATTDPEVLATAYGKWGPVFPRWVVGEYAMALWDAGRGWIVLARDAMGTRPLYYTILGRGGLAFSSSIGSLLLLPGMRRDLNDLRVAEFLVGQLGAGGNTFYRGVRRLQPAHVLLYCCASGSTNVTRYWHPEHMPEQRYSSDAEVDEAFRRVFDRAVRCRLAASGSPGIAMSGGFDSGAVACVAAEALAKQGGLLRAYTAVPRTPGRDPHGFGTIADESPLVLEVASRLRNIVPTFVGAGDRGPLTALDQDFHRFHAPLWNVSNRYWIDALEEQAAGDGIDLLLNGQTGNSTISWWAPGYLAMHARALRLQALIPELAAWARFHRLSVGAVVRSRILAPIVPRRLLLAYLWLRTGADPRTANSFIRPRFAHAVDIQSRLAAVMETVPARTSSDPHLNRVRMMQLGMRETGDLLAHRAAANNLVVSDPTADRRVVEFCMGLPLHAFVRGGVDRLLVRRGFRDQLARRTVESVDRGQQASDLRSRLARQWCELGTDLTAMERHDKVQKYLDLAAMRELHESMTCDRLAAVSLRKLLELLRGHALGRFVMWTEAA